MSKNLGRFKSHVAAISVAAGLAAVAGASYLDFGDLAIMAPSEIVAGNPINGYVTGLENDCIVDGFIFGSGLLGPRVYGYDDPLFFSYPTHEYQAPGVATIRANDTTEVEFASVILK